MGTVLIFSCGATYRKNENRPHAFQMMKHFFFLTLLVLGSAGCATVAHKPPRTAIPLTGGVYHTVSQGQTLWRIAKAYNVSLNELMRVNGISTARQLPVGQRLLIPGAAVVLPVKPFFPSVPPGMENIVGLKNSSLRWQTITIHHSGTLQGNAAAFDRNHRQRHMGGLFYHFVIGNGDGAGDGAIEVGWRWKKQVQVNRPKDIQICLVGDFNRQKISEKQFDSLVKLISVLRAQYDISLSNVRQHKSIKGKHTACPGDSLPFDRIISELRNNGDGSNFYANRSHY